MSPEAAKAASTEVIVVPMFDPRVKGYILSTLISPSPTSGVRVEVNTDELCTNTVRIAPIKIATYPVKNLKHPGKSAFTILFKVLAIGPFIMELSTFTIPTKQQHRMTREVINNIMPATLSLRSNLLNSEKPENRKVSEINF